MEGRVVEGVVTPGRQIGQTIGFPTANIPLQEGLCEPGVYHTQVQVEGDERRYEAMSNVGWNPSVGGQELRLESHLFGFEGSLYGRRIRVTLMEKIRDERRFDSVEELRLQLVADRKQILHMLENK
ncbi:MAG: riboflavin kinase [Alistipes sp.]|nr:riboflavin kinase [Alistipes sp.]